MHGADAAPHAPAHAGGGRVYYVYGRFPMSNLPNIFAMWKLISAPWRGGQNSEGLWAELGPGPGMASFAPASAPRVFRCTARTHRRAEQGRGCAAVYHHQGRRASRGRGWDSDRTYPRGAVVARARGGREGGGQDEDEDDGSSTGRGVNPNDAIMGSGPSFKLDGLASGLILFGIIAFQFFVVAFL